MHSSECSHRKMTKEMSDARQPQTEQKHTQESKSENTASRQQKRRRRGEAEGKGGEEEENAEGRGGGRRRRREEGSDEPTAKMLRPLQQRRVGVHKLIRTRAAPTLLHLLLLKNGDSGSERYRLSPRQSLAES